MEGVNSGPVQPRLLIAIIGLVLAAMLLMHFTGHARGCGLVDSLIRLGRWIG